MRILAGDVGGTKTLLAIYEHDASGTTTELRRERFASRAYASLSEVLRAFLGAGSPGVSRVAFGVAGPVVDGRCAATNLPWRIDARELASDLDVERVRLINDFHAVALGIGVLDASELVVLQDAPIVDGAPVAIVGAGTGLGEAVLLPSRDGPTVLATEGGHADFAPRNEVEMALLRFLLGRHSRVSYERVLSGPGIVTLWEFVTSTGLAPALDSTRARLASEDGPAVIGALALSGGDPAATRAVELFVSLYGAEAGNLALKVLPYGGLYVAGGIAGKLLAPMREGAFMRSFLDKGRMRPLLERVRVAVVATPDVGLIGARTAAERQ